MAKNFKYRFPRWLLNRYLIVGLVFVVWMLFLDDNSYIFHKNLDRELNDLEEAKDHYQTEIEKDKAILQELDSSDLALERIAREEYNMKRKDEDVFIIKEKEEAND